MIVFDKISLDVTINTVHVVVPVSSFMPGEITDWPQNIQDGFYASVERFQAERGDTYKIVKSWCELNYDTSEWEARLILQGPPKKYEGPVQ